MSLFTSSYQPSSGAIVQRKADALPLPFLARPQAMTVYVRFVEMGTILTANARVLQVGDGTFGVSSGLLIMSRGSAGNDMYRFNYNANFTNVQSQLSTAPALGDVVELMGQLLVDDDGNASVQLHQSIAGAAATTAAESGAISLLPTWASQFLYFNSRNASLNVGFIAIREVGFHRGVQPFSTMRRLAGVI